MATPTLQYEFGRFQLEVSQRLLLRDGVRIHLTDKAFDTLVALVENHNRLVLKEELLNRVWADTFVEEATLAQNIFTVRQALSDGEGGTRYVETIPKRGYRFIAPVREILEGEAHSVTGAARLGSRMGSRRLLRLTVTVGLALSVIAAYSVWVHFARRGPPSGGRVLLAVMPFENLTGDPQEEYFSDGFTEEMITQLGSMDTERLGVIARTSAMQYKNARKDTKQIGSELGVDYILEGSVRRAGDHVRISAQLIEVRDQTHRWAKEYDRELRDVLALQGNVARAIADEINLSLTSNQQARLTRVAPVNTEAYDDYLKGRYEWNRRTPKSVENSITYYLKAAQADPNYALAYAGLADSYNILGNLGVLPPKEAYPRAMAAANEALGLDRELPQAESALALATYLYQWDWTKAEKGFKRAIELNPSYGPTHQWYAVCLVSRERSDEAIGEMKLAAQVEPDSMIINAVGAWIDFLAGKYDEGIQQARNTLGLDPSFERARIYLGMTLGEKGIYPDAIVELQGLPQESTGPFMLAALGYVYARAGEKEKAYEVLQEMNDRQRKGYFPATDLAIVYSGLGEKEKAFEWLQKAYEERDPWLIHLQVEPRLAALRSDSRFRTLVRRVGLPSGNDP